MEATEMRGDSKSGRGGGWLYEDSGSRDLEISETVEV